MADIEPGAEILNLRSDFPPVPTADWEAAIQKDLKGADYEKKLVWRTDEGIAVRPYYRREHIVDLPGIAGAVPGEFPYARGSGKTWEEAQEWSPPAGAIRADYLHEAGATVVQEIGYSLAEAVEKLADAVDQGRSVDEAAPATVFVFAAGSNYLFEIAKIRAMRALWANAVAAFEPRDPRAGTARIHVRTARSNKSVYDPYTNLLRVTTEALSAVLGGCDSLAVEPFGFDPHLALNIQRILREEAHVGRVADPGGGSYYIEALTDALARAGWKLFQQVEAEGGWSKALASASVEKALEASRAAKAKAVSTRRRTLVGVNNYPDLKEKTAEAGAPAPMPHDPFPQWRMAEPFEKIRQRTVRHAAATGRPPKVLLLKRGDLKMKVARANFCLNFFGCAGFDIVESDEYETADADLIVLCSSDAEYLPLANEVCLKVKVPVLVAGNPKDQIEKLKAAGVAGFVHILSDAVETLTEWQNRLGLKE